MLAEDTLERCQRILGRDHVNTVRVANDLALALALVGETKQARKMYANVWGTVIEDFGEYRYVLDELLSARVSV